MAEPLNFREAVQRAGVSRQRLNEAITSGRLPAQRGGGPGKRTTIQFEDLQAWCVSEGLAMPVDTGERLERSARSEVTELMPWMMQMSAAMERVEATLERLERSHAPAVSSPTPEKRVRPRADNPQKAALLQRLRALQAEGLSLQAIANRFNTEGVPTLSGKGRWQKGTISKLLAQEE